MGKTRGTDVSATSGSRRKWRLRQALLNALSVIALSPYTQGAAVLIRTAKPYSKVVTAIEQRGGKVTHQFRYIEAIAAEIPDDAMSAIRALLPAGCVSKDLMVNLPQAALDRRSGTRLLASEESAEVESLSAGELAAITDSSPDAYLINNTSLNLGSVHAAGFTGQGVKVAVIDSGIRPGRPHLSLDGSVIGGEDLVGDGLGFSNIANDGHGTFVAGMISANVVFTFPNSRLLVKSLKKYCDACVETVPNSTSTRVPMIGSAPLSSIYALRVFPPAGGAPTSRVIAAMERVLQLRENFDSGLPETKDASGKYTALNIKVCNMSLGGSTIFAGHDLEDKLTRAFLEHDIVLVVSAGNAGPSGTTGASPATGFDALTVGASSSPVHERVFWDLNFGVLGIGELFRPSDRTQTAYFSSRGPTADGRMDPDVMANGFGSFGQGFSSSTNVVNMASGTSFSGPTVAGVAAVLRQAAPGATARQVRNALIASAKPGLITDGSGPLDRGSGYVNAAGALSLLQAGGVPDTFGAAGVGNTNVNVNILQAAGVPTLNGNVTQVIQGLLPGQRVEIYYHVHPNTTAVIVSLSNLITGANQNTLFGDDILLTVHSAKTSAIDEGDYRVFEFTKGGTFVVPNPETGLMRVSVNGDWTNASSVGATVNIFSVTDPAPQFTSQGRLLDGEIRVVPFQVSAGALKLDARLGWRQDWGSYPSNDIDLILIDPNGHLDVDGATLNNPEATSIKDPRAGNWLAVVHGFFVPSVEDKFELRIAVDGKVLK
jgi:hypothetical protein